jgi:hypothetical protein
MTGESMGRICGMFLLFAVIALPVSAVVREADDDKVKAAEKAYKEAVEKKSRTEQELSKKLKDAEDNVKKLREKKDRVDKEEMNRVKAATKAVQAAASRRSKDGKKGEERYKQAQEALREARDSQNRKRQEGSKAVQHAHQVVRDIRQEQSRKRNETQKLVKEAEKALRDAKEEAAARKRESELVSTPPPSPPKSSSKKVFEVRGKVASAYADPPRTLLNLKVDGRSEEVPVYLGKDTDVTYVDIPRSGRRPTAGYLVSVWLREGGTGEVIKAVFKDPEGKK